MNRIVGAAFAGVLVAAVVVPAVVIPASRAEASATDGSLNVRVIRDINGNGTYEPLLELGVAGASVTIVDAAGTTAAGTTGPDGTITADLSKLTGGKYRVQVTPPAGSVLQPAPEGTGLSSTTSFVDVSNHQNASLTVGLWNPADYCQDNPTLVTACQRNSVVPGPNPGARSLVSVPFTARGTSPAPTQLATQGQTGTVYGIAYSKADKRIFSSAYAKRAAAYGPGGQGAIYVTDTVANTTKLFATVPNAGTTAHAMQTTADAPFINVVGKESLGAMRISEDGTTLYVVNLADRKLYLFDAAAGAPKGSYAIPDPGCPAAGDWRPGGLGVHDGLVYVGGVCSGESTQKQADMRVVVRTFANGAFGPVLVDHPLNFQRGNTLWWGSGTDHWLPWQTTFKQPAAQGGNSLLANPEPLLTDVRVERGGDLVLGFRDRFGDQGGRAMQSPGAAGTFDTVSGGDLNRVCLVNGTYAWEGTAGCASNNTTANNGGGEPTYVAEYYPGEYLNSAQYGTPHNEIAQGGLAVLYGATQMPATIMDPLDVNQGGLGWFDRANGTMANGAHSNAYLISDVATEGWAKANGLADLEALCDQAPVQIGDRVWYDTNANGIQDPDEPAIGGVTVQLLPCAGGAPLATKTTDAQGRYYFGTADGLKPNTCYTLQFDYSKIDPTTLPGSPPASSLKWTVASAGSDPLIDSNVDTAGKATVNVGKAGSVDHGIDAGIMSAQDKVGDYAWSDTNRNGIQDAGEPGIAGVPVTLQDGTGKVIATSTTDANGKYLFDNLPDGTYKVCFDTTKLPASYADYVATKQNAAGHNGTDSAIDPTGCTMTTTLGADKREDLTLDAGFVAPPNRVGDYVWSDTNRNGIQDAGEPGIAGVPVTLQDGNGQVVATTSTGADGKYLFDNLPDGTYKVCFDTKKLPTSYADYVLTKQNAAGHNGTDSAADTSTGCTMTTTLGIGHREDLTLDAGFVSPANRVGDYVWSDTNRNGIQDTGEPGIAGVPVTLQDGNGQQVAATTTDANGKYLFDNLPDGTYKVCFDTKMLPAKYADNVLTKQNAAGHNGTDSAADTSTGCTMTTTLGIGHREDLTLDAGFVTPLNRVGDYVWLDSNRNGIQDAGEPGIADVPVTLQDGNGQQVATSSTDANGKYLFDNLPDGTYKVCFDTKKLPAKYADYVLTKQDAAGQNGTDSAADPANGCTRTTSLAIGHREDLTLDAGFISPPNRVGDYVWSDTNRNGIQDAGEPGIADVPVTLQDGNGQQVAATTTGADGKYLFDNLPDGTYKVCFDTKMLPAKYADNVLTKQNAAGHNGTDSAADTGTGCTMTTTLGVGHREDLTLDAGFISPLNRVGDYVWLDSNHNGIQDAGEPGIADVPVTLQDGNGQQVATSSTDANGKYLFDNLPDGTYKVCFDTKKLPAKYADYVLTKQDAAGQNGTDSAADPATGCTRTTTLAIGHREDLTLDAGFVTPPNRVGDYVWSDTNRNGIQDAGEPGIAGVPVTLQDGNGQQVATSSTDANGKYLFDNLPDGTYKVCFDTKMLPAKYADFTFTKQDAAGQNGTDSAADQTTGCTRTTSLAIGHREDLTLDAGFVAPPNRVGDYVWLDSNRNGIQDAGEPSLGDVPVTLQDGNGQQVGTMNTGADGKYLFDNLPDGTYKVCFDPTKLPAKYADYTLTKQDAAGQNGTDSAADPTTGCTRTTTLGVGHREDLTLDAGFIAPPNRVGDFVWSDTNRNGIQDAGEPGIADMPVVLQDGNGQQVATTTTDANGKYLFDNLPDGTYKVCFDPAKLPAKYADFMVTKQDAAGQNGTDSAADTSTGCTMPVTVGVGHRENLTLDAGFVSPTNRLGDYVWSDTNRNGIQDAGEPGLANVPVTVRDGNGQVVATTSTDANGKYLVDNLPDGTYKVCLELAKLPKNLMGDSFTKPNAAGDNGTDSAADPATGCTRTVSLAAGHRQDLTMDIGLVNNPTPAPSPNPPTPGLAFTGANVIWMSATALALLIGGAVLIIVGRRRKTNY